LIKENERLTFYSDEDGKNLLFWNFINKFGIFEIKFVSKNLQLKVGGGIKNFKIKRIQLFSLGFFALTIDPVQVSHHFHITLII
jgi:hypothetical protein